MRDDPSNGSKNRISEMMWSMAGMGFDLAAAVAGFTLIGWLIDRHWATSPRYTVVGLAFGLIGGMYNFVRRAMRASREAAKADHEAELDREAHESAEHPPRKGSS